MRADCIHLFQNTQIIQPKTHETAMKYFYGVLFSILFLPAYSFAADSFETKIVGKSGEEIGSLKISQGTQGVVVNIKASNLPAGYHGMHFHAVADCDHAGGFKSAKGHVDPDKKPHGFLNEEGPHEGNLPNLIVAEDGTVEVELYSSLVSLKDGKANLLDADGSSLVIHANPDDHTSQPIGGSGGRIACAVIAKQ